MDQRHRHQRYHEAVRLDDRRETGHSRREHYQRQGGATQRIYVGPTATGPNAIFDRILVANAAIGNVVDGSSSNSPPTISDIADRTIPEDTSTGTVNFTVGDAETAANGLV